MDIDAFFNQDLLARFTEDVAAAHDRLAALEAEAGEPSKQRADRLRRRLDRLEDTDVTLRVEVSGDGGGDYYLNVEDGELSVSDAPAESPVVWVTQTAEHFRAMHAEGMNALDLVGGGKPGKIPDPAVADRVRDLNVTLKIVLSGLAGGVEAATVIRLGEGNEVSTPAMTMHLDLADVKEMATGRLDPAQAFMAGKIRIDGDVSIAMRLASLGLG